MSQSGNEDVSTYFLNMPSAMKVHIWESSLLIDQIKAEDKLPRSSHFCDMDRQRERNKCLNFRFDTISRTWLDFFSDSRGIRSRTNSKRRDPRRAQES